MQGACRARAGAAGAAAAATVAPAFPARRCAARSWRGRSAQISRALAARRREPRCRPRPRPCRRRAREREPESPPPERSRAHAEPVCRRHGHHGDLHPLHRRVPALRGYWQVRAAARAGRAGTPETGTLRAAGCGRTAAPRAPGSSRLGARSARPRAAPTPGPWARPPDLCARSSAGPCSARPPGQRPGLGARGSAPRGRQQVSPERRADVTHLAAGGQRGAARGGGRGA